MEFEPQLNEIDFDALHRRMQDAPAFPHFCIDDFLESAFAQQVHDAFPSYRDATAMGETFSAVNEKRKTQVTDWRRFPPPILALHQLLASEAFVQRLSRMSGIAGLTPDPGLSGGGIHETAEGGRLDVHVDFNFHEQLGMFRRLNILIYFNPQWRPEYGGYLDLWDRDVKHCVASIAPVFNRAAGFATGEHSWHGVTPVRCPPGVARKSFAAYYYTPDPPPGWDGRKHSTIFRARPDEYLRGAIAMPAENALRATRRTVRTLAHDVRKALKL
jgi:2OG-Fe(II) oxygenase superfamily